MGHFDFIPGTKDFRERLKTHQRKKYRSRSLSDITHLAIHHSLTKVGSAESFARYHVNHNQWPGIGYHFVVDKKGVVKWCHDLEVRSYHVGNSNRKAVGICIVGDFREEELTAIQLRPTIKLVQFLMRELDIRADQVLGHNEFPDYSWKACPVFDMEAFRASLQPPKPKPKPQAILLEPEPQATDDPAYIGPVDRRFDFRLRDFSSFLNPNDLHTHPGESVIQAAHRQNRDDIGAIKTRNQDIDLKKPSKKPQVIRVKGPVEKVPPKVKMLIDTLKSKKYAYFKNDRKPYNLNIVGVRSEQAAPNSFDDKLYTFWKEDNRWRLRQFEVTTDPGLSYLGKKMGDKEGTAILKEGQYRKTYRIGKHRGLYDALVQADEVTVIRDFDQDGRLDFASTRERTGFFGINIHHASYTGRSTQVDGWSAGCQVFASIKEYEEFMKLCKQAQDHWGDLFTYTLLNERDLVT